MSTSTDGKLVYGVSLSEEGIEGYANEVPWDDEEYEHEIETWWLAINNAPDNDAYWKKYRAWESKYNRHKRSTNENLEQFKSKHPEVEAEYNRVAAARRNILNTLPVQEVRHCSDNYTMYILAVKDHVYTNSRGYMTEVDSLDVDKVDEAKAREFCNKYKIPFEPKWYLVSYWG